MAVPCSWIAPLSGWARDAGLAVLRIRTGRAHAAARIYHTIITRARVRLLARAAAVALISTVAECAGRVAILAEPTCVRDEIVEFTAGLHVG